MPFWESTEGRTRLLCCISLKHNVSPSWRMRWKSSTSLIGMRGAGLESHTIRFFVVFSATAIGSRLQTYNTDSNDQRGKNWLRSERTNSCWVFLNVSTLKCFHALILFAFYLLPLFCLHVVLFYTCYVISVMWINSIYIALLYLFDCILCSLSFTIYVFPFTLYE